MTTRTHWLCRLGLHHWYTQFKFVGAPQCWYDADFMAQYDIKKRRYCCRPNCKRGEWEDV